MIIAEEHAIEIAIINNFNMKLFESYLKYQKKNRHEHKGKWSVEEFAAAKKYEGGEIDISNQEWLEWFSNYMGFGSRYAIPECLSFLRYCSCRDLYPYNEREAVLKRIKKDDESN